MTELPHVSIIINNYNYGRFLADAIESALSQRYQPVEVIVVDDGSADESRQVIAGYGDRIKSILQANRGQGSALNAGFARSRGELIIFLDSDDRLDPSVVARVVQCYQRNPTAARIQYRLEIMDADGRPTGRLKPPKYLDLPSGDMRQRLQTSPDDIPWAPTSGNAFPAWVLRQILPMPEEVYRRGADYYLSNLTPLFGAVLVLEGLGGWYRDHDGSDNHFKQRVNLAQTRQIILWTSYTHRYVTRYWNRLGLNHCLGEQHDHPSVTFVANRLVSLKLDAHRHPIPDETVAGLVREGIQAARRRDDVTRPLRIFYVLWFLLMALAPRPLAGWLAVKFFYPETRQGLDAVFAHLQAHQAPPRKYGSGRSGERRAA